VSWGPRLVGGSSNGAFCSQGYSNLLSYCEAPLHRCGLLLHVACSMVYVPVCVLGIPVCPAKIKLPVKMPFGVGHTCVSPGNRVLDGGGLHWRHLLNTVERSICSRYVALCQITLATLSLDL